jgi:polysaccharide biosynthesis transport protein
MLKRLKQTPEPTFDAQIHGGEAGAKIDVEKLLAVARRQYPVVIFAIVIALLLAMAYIATAVPLYMTTTDIFIDSQKDQSQAATSVADLTFDTGAIDSQVEILKSDKIALAVVSALKLTQDPEFIGTRGSILGEAFSLFRSMFSVGGWFASQPSADADVRVDLERSAVARLKANMDARRVARTYILAIDYTSPDRNKAAAISNAYADAYIAEQLGAKSDATRRAGSWLQTRITELKQKSLETDLAIQKYKADKGLVSADGKLVSDQAMTELTTQQALARTETARAEARYAQISDLLKSGQTDSAVTDSMGNPIITDLRQKFLRASKSEGELESKLGKSHLQVIGLRHEMDEYRRLIFEELQRIADSYKSDAEVARGKEQSLTQSMSGLERASAANDQTLVQLRELERESETYRTLYQSFLQRYQEAVQQESFPMTEARVITGATPPTAPSFPKRSLILALSLILGSITGASVGVLREYRDRVFRTAEQVRTELGLEFLGMLEAVKHSPIGGRHEVSRGDDKQIDLSDSIQRYTIDHPLSSFSESLRTAKVATDLMLGDHARKIIGFISALPGEGKTTISKNFASLLAHLGARTLLIDGDLRNPGLTQTMAKEATVGILEVISGQRRLAHALMVEPESGLFFLPAVARKRVQHSSQVLSSLGTQKMLAEAGEAFDYVIIDLPPLGPVVDVRAAASMFDAFVVVVEWGRTARSMVQNIVTSDRVLSEKCVGVLLNRVDLKKSRLYETDGSKDYYSSRYGKYYHNDSKVA